MITIGNTDDSGKGKHFKSRFIQPGLVKIEGHGIVLLKKDTIDNSLKSMVGSPVIIRHQDITNDNADELRCGVISDAYFNDEDGWYYAEGVIWNDKALSYVKKGWSVSCSYDFTEYDDAGGVENNIKYDKEFTKLNFTHLALVDNPRYERANIVFNCKVDNGNDNKYPAGTEGGKGGQFAPKSKPFEGYTYDLLKRANLMAGVQDFEASKSGYAVRFTIPDENFVAREKVFAKRLDEDAKVSHYAFGDVDDRKRRRITIQFVKSIKNEKDQDKMILDALKDLVSHIENAKDSDANGRWVTIKGTHVFIPDGKDIGEVIKEKFDKGGYAGDEEGVTGLISKEKDKQELDKISEMREHLAKEDRKRKKELKGKYEREDVEWDEEQLVKDIKETQSFGYEEVEDIAEFLGLDEDEVRETLANTEADGSDSKSEIKLQVSDEFRSKKHPDGIVFDLIGEDELIKGFEDALKGQTISKELEAKLSKEMQKYANLPGWSDKFEQMWDEVDDYYDQWKEAGGKRKENKTYINAVDKLFSGVDSKKRERIEKVAAFLNEHPDNYMADSKAKAKVQRLAGVKLSKHDWEEFEANMVEDVEDREMRQKLSQEEFDDWSNKKHAKDLIEFIEWNKTNNSKENDMAILEELKKLITKVENEKGEQDMDEKEKVDNEQIDKRKLIDEVGGMLKNKVDEEVWRTIIGKLEKIAYNGSEDSKADNKKVKNEDEEDKKVKNEDEEDKKVKNEDAKDKEKVEEVKEDVKEDVENKCKNSKSSFDKINEIYNSVKTITESKQYMSRQDKLDAAVEYFS